jgi:O-acetyl-ADP-ribose deacetylase
MVEKKVGDKVIRLVEGDITDMEVEAFVYDITDDAKLGTGYGNAIAMRAGQAVQKELDEIGSVPTGHAVFTGAGKLKAKAIIHVNGPKFHEPETEAKLKNATLAALTLADEKGLTQLAFPPVGSGFYQVPLDVCARVMVDTVAEYMTNGGKLNEVIFVALDTREFKPLKAKIEGAA